MNIGTHGEVEEISFWPAEEIAAAFARVNAAMGKENEAEEMRLFVRTMNYFFEHANTAPSEIGDEEMSEFCRLAKKGLLAELGITAPEE